MKLNVTIGRLVLLAFVPLSVAPATGKSPTLAFRKTSVPMRCAFGNDVYSGTKGEPCSLSYGQKNDVTGHPKDTDLYQWRTRGGRVVTFVGRKDDGVRWWFGRINGKPASGFDLNRNHYVFASRDGEFEFECWIGGWGRGTY